MHDAHFSDVVPNGHELQLYLSEYILESLINGLYHSELGLSITAPLTGITTTALDVALLG